ncbi:MAG: ribonuclease HI [Crocinitomicaceae bacterium]|nr:ribonuclease HI [Crocinitomicaceae bacterium]
MSEEIIIYTDGAAKGNPGPGGYGIVLMAGKHYKEVSEGFRHTTNNRMELLSVCIALEMLKNPGSIATVYSDSRYVVDSIEKKWIDGWVKRNWKNVKNPDLWQRFLKIYTQHKVKFKWVRGHNGNPMNERCDVLAVAASNRKNLQTDTWFETHQADK